MLVVICKPLPVEDNLLDVSTFDELGLQAVIADGALNLALRQDTIKLGA